MLHTAVREPILYPLLNALREKYGADGARIVVQTNGDLVTEKIISELLDRNVWIVSVAGMDDFHVGVEGQKRVPLQERLTRWFEAAGMRRSGLQVTNRQWHPEGRTPLQLFRRDRGRLDWQDLAARSGVDERSVACRDLRHFLQCLVGRA